MNAPMRTPAAAGSRKAEALVFITGYIQRTGQSPSTGEIAAALGVGRTRAKALVHQLANDKAVTLGIGQRAIRIPGLFDALVLDRLRTEGWVVNEDAKTIAAPCPQWHLPLMPEIVHVPDDFMGDGDDGHHDSSGDRA